jgi:hypothetical protein
VATIHTATGPLVMPLVGLGTWKGQPGQTRKAVRRALAAGYRHVDCAEYYGNENEVGAGLTDAFAADPQLARDDVRATRTLPPSLPCTSVCVPKLREQLVGVCAYARVPPAFGLLAFAIRNQLFLSAHFRSLLPGTRGRLRKWKKVGSGQRRCDMVHSSRSMSNVWWYFSRGWCPWLCVTVCS